MIAASERLVQISADLMATLTSGFGGILHVVNDTGGSSTIANPDTPVTVVTYP